MKIDYLERKIETHSYEIKHLKHLKCNNLDEIIQKKTNFENKLREISSYENKTRI